MRIGTGNQVYFGGATVALALLFIFQLIPWGITPMPGPAALSPQFWPRIISWFLLLVGLSMVITGMFAGKYRGGIRDGAAGGISLRSTGRVAIVVAGMILFAAALPLLGIYVASVLMVLALSPMMGNRRWGTVVAVAVVIPLLLSLFFSRIAGTALPRGVFDFLPF